MRPSCLPALSFPSSRRSFTVQVAVHSLFTLLTFIRCSPYSCSFAVHPIETIVDELVNTKRVKHRGGVAKFLEIVLGDLTKEAAHDLTRTRFRQGAGKLHIEDKSKTNRRQIEQIEDTQKTQGLYSVSGVARLAHTGFTIAEYRLQSSV